ncbi:MAG: PilZ domain-containing protein [Gammaproteobacteria bacterium]|nr:PilZ domain-containing protein [Gammaproteobacteria bacterium]
MSAVNIEKRWSDRRIISTDVKIIFNGRSYYAKTRDVGLGGMFIDLNHVLIPRDTIIKVIMLGYRENERYTTFNTRVAFVTPQGYGLEFREFETNQVRQLQSILYESPHEIIRLA